jgi:hypothetical protein
MIIIKIHCLYSQNCLLAVQALGKFKLRFTMPHYIYSEILLLTLETSLTNLKNGGGKVLLVEVEFDEQHYIHSLISSQLVITTHVGSWKEFSR